MTTPPRSKWPRAKPPRLTVSEVKALVRYRDGYRCTDCGMTAREHVRLFGTTLEVHRIVPGSRYTLKGCVALCRLCHSKKPKSITGIRPRDCLVCAKEPLAEQAEVLAERNATNLTQEVNRALRELLAREGLWPPSSAGAGS
jgi:hypothetical protein